jgi:hypothetical protein
MQESKHKKKEEKWRSVDIKLGIFSLLKKDVWQCDVKFLLL